MKVILFLLIDQLNGRLLSDLDNKNSLFMLKIVHKGNAILAVNKEILVDAYEYRAF
ncbi:hypothetical protein [Emticicia sp. W12TSBA100-4]|uniref:hypothetical protein n=1 Tax=Emticicia sp. W12TSBA100-4 TaxID=3160965 RepID=UPI0033065EF5